MTEKERVSKGPQKKSERDFDYDLHYAELNLREQPELYRVGRGEQGVLLVQPYKAEILPHWRFATPDKARESSDKIYAMFLGYLAQGDFVGADMARKFLQMGFTRARRYANHKGGKKYDGPVPDDKKGQSGAHGRAELPRQPEDPIKAEAARIFKAKWDEAEANTEYAALKKDWKARLG
ncbi:hypothetical protein GCM10017783_19420 [Deinococcus piscis]|uniref:Cytoplasmic protein n=1 Tax=Deinococcus piscis TaxID=394230 RepID=A0ABQ3K8P3_9DEIO|nr:DUF4385 domain-containing protein [Deinococcus piscis]GHG06966.1 hypothetical protein GCM10017783_19420 [Deinococcus piscis]